MPKVMRSVADPSTEHGFRIEPATYEQAEELAGFRLDRRRKYWITEDDEVEVDGVVTLSCSGCSCGCEGGCSCGPSSGCSECGYTGKRRIHFGYPAQSPSSEKNFEIFNHLLPPRAAWSIIMAKVIAQITARLPRLMEAGEYRKLRYAGGKPSLQQLKKWIEEGEVVGEVKGGMYFVDLQAAVIGSNDPLLAKMMEVG